ncbi:MAG: hypothetical protein MI743_18215 [Sneathiellales bacterium]|nr:hypothetical protein [Sneathiellales bacterium]
MKSLLKTVAVAFGALGLMISAASAATVSFTNMAVPGDYPAPIPSLVATSSTNLEAHTTSSFGSYTSPWDGSPFAGSDYYAVRSGGSATFSGFGETTQISFLWGSVDTYNSIIFNLVGGGTEEVLGSDVIISGAPSGDGAIDVLITTASAFDSFQFISTDDSFEYANLQVSVVPLPAALPLYGAGMAIIGFIGWRRRKNSA